MLSLYDLKNVIAAGRLDETLRYHIGIVFESLVREHAEDSWMQAYLESEQRRLLIRLREWMRYEADRLPFTVEKREERLDNVSVGDLKLNPDTHEVLRGERALDLTQREFELLEYLMRNERIVVSRQRLLDEVWGYDPFSMTNTIEVFVSNLRRKLEADGEPRLLHTIRGAGYVLRV